MSSKETKLRAAAMAAAVIAGTGMAGATNNNDKEAANTLIKETTYDNALKTAQQVEIDFVCNQYNKRYYIQSALSLVSREKTLQEERPLLNIPDNFKKIIVVKDNIKSWFTEEGILVVGLQEFLLNENSLNL